MTHEEAQVVWFFCRAQGDVYHRAKVTANVKDGGEGSSQALLIVGNGDIGESSLREDLL